MLHFSHPDPEVPIQVLGFLEAILYHGNNDAQNKIGHHCNHKDFNFFQKMHKILDIVISVVRQPAVDTHGHSNGSKHLVSQQLGTNYMHI